MTTHRYSFHVPVTLRQQIVLKVSSFIMILSHNNCFRWSAFKEGGFLLPACLAEKKPKQHNLAEWLVWYHSNATGVVPLNSEATHGNYAVMHGSTLQILFRKWTDHHRRHFIIFCTTYSLMFIMYHVQLYQKRFVSDKNS